MQDTSPVPATPPDTPDFFRRLGRALAEAALSCPRPPLRHTGPCGKRAFCPRGCRDDAPTLERLGNGHILVYCCVRDTLTPLDWRYPEFAAAFLP